MNSIRCTTVLSVCLVLAAVPAVAQDGDGGAEDPHRVPDPIRTTPWKETAPGTEDLQGLEAFEHRLGTWVSEGWVGEGAERHRVRAVYTRELDGRIIRVRSYKVYEDGAEDLYLDETLYFHPGQGRVAAQLTFDDGLIADAVWLLDENGYRRLDCDLYWPDGRTGQVRDFFRPVSEDRILWTMYWVRDGQVDEEPSSRITLVRESGGGAGGATAAAAGPGDRAGL